MKTAKITKLEFSREWKTKDGKPGYQFSIEFDNDDKGSCSFWTKEPWCKVGDSVQYDGPEGDYHKISLKQQGGGGGGRGGWRPLTAEESAAQERAKYPSFAVSYWKDALVALISTGIPAEKAIADTKGWPEAFYHKMIELGKKA